MSMTTTVRRLLTAACRSGASRATAPARSAIDPTNPPSRARCAGPPRARRRAPSPLAPRAPFPGAFRHFRTLAPTRAGDHALADAANAVDHVPDPGAEPRSHYDRANKPAKGVNAWKRARKKAAFIKAQAKTHRENRAARAAGRSGGWSGGERSPRINARERRRETAPELRVATERPLDPQRHDDIDSRSYPDPRRRWRRASARRDATRRDDAIILLDLNTYPPPLRAASDPSPGETRGRLPHPRSCPARPASCRT